jgi:hypothetical protein
MRTRHCRSLLSCFLLVGALQCHGADIDFKTDGQLERIPGDTLWRLLPNLWTRKTIVVNCPNSKGVTTASPNYSLCLVHLHVVYMGFARIYQSCTAQPTGLFPQ